MPYQAEREELAAIEAELAKPEAVAVLDRVQGFHSMARLATANYQACLDHLGRLSDRRFSMSLLDDPQAPDSVLYVEQLQHCAANHVLSSVLLLEHIEHHVTAHFPDPKDRTRGQFELGLDASVNGYDGHPVVLQIRHLIAHRSLPRIWMVPGSHPESAAAPRRQEDQAGHPRSTGASRS